MSDEHEPASVDPTDPRLRRLDRRTDTLALDLGELREFLLDLRKRVEALEEKVGS